MSGGAQVLEYGTFPNPPSPSSATTWRARPARAHSYEAGPAGTRKRCWRRWSASRRGSSLVPVVEALARQQEERGAVRRPRGAGHGREGRGRRRDGPAAGPVRRPLVVYTRRSPPSPSPGGCRPSAGRLSCPCSGWRRTTMTSRRSVRSRSSTRRARCARCATPAARPAGRPASRVLLDDGAPALVDELGRAAAGLHRDAACERIASCYRPGFSLSSAFARLSRRSSPTSSCSTPPIPPSRSIWSR